MSARVPVGPHHAVDALCLGHYMVVDCMTADSERAGLDYRTVGVMPVVMIGRFRELSKRLFLFGGSVSLKLSGKLPIP